MRIYLFLLLLLAGFSGNAQISVSLPFTVKGKVIDAGNGEILAGATVVNIASQYSALTDATGHFVITCKQGDKLAASYMGYKTVVLVISDGSDYLTQQIALTRQNFQLNEFIVRPKYTQYQFDSVERRSTYQRTLARRHDGSLASPFSFVAEKLSKRSKDMFRFQKAFAQLEDERFLDTKYTPELVAQMTHLTGDTLAHFMNAYPVPYDYARVASDLEFKMWIRTNYREWVAKGRPMPVLHADTVAHP